MVSHPGHSTSTALQHDKWMSQSLILSCAMRLKMYVSISFHKCLYAQTASRLTSPTCHWSAGKYCAIYRLVDCWLGQVWANNHIAVDEWALHTTLLLYEDILACTLAYEQNLHQWIIAELEARWGDSGRLTYEEVSGCLHSFGVMPCQYFRYSEVHNPYNIACTPHTVLSLSWEIEPLIRNGGSQVRPLWTPGLSWH